VGAGRSGTTIVCGDTPRLGELLDLCDDRIDLTVAQQVVEVWHCTGSKAVGDDLPQVVVGSAAAPVALTCI